MSTSIGALEFRSIAKGIEVANEIVKKSSVEIIYFRTICPGKFIVIVSGNEGEINEAIDYGETIVDGLLVDSFKVHAVSNAIVNAFGNKYEYKEIDGALGIMETMKVCAGIKALDMTLKSSDVKLLKLHLAFCIGGKLYFVVTGSVSSIEYGLNQGKLSLDKNEHANISIIPSPSSDMTKYLL